MAKERKIRIPIEREVVDTDTGEVSMVGDEVVFNQSDFSKWFKLTFMDRETDQIPLDGLGKQFVVFYVILKRVIWEDCTVEIGAATKSAITRHAGIQDGMIRNYMKEYVSNRLLKKIKGSSYMINPTFFFKGEEAEQRRLHKIFMLHGKTIL